MYIYNNIIFVIMLNKNVFIEKYRNFLTVYLYVFENRYFSIYLNT